MDWVIPIKSFIEEYSVIFAPDANYETLKEKQRIFKEYKDLINKLIEELLSEIEMNKQEFMELVQSIAHMVSGDTIKVLYAVEDFDLFSAVMTDRNKRIHEYTMKQLSKSKPNIPPSQPSKEDQ